MITSKNNRLRTRFLTVVKKVPILLNAPGAVVELCIGFGYVIRFKGNTIAKHYMKICLS